jgi:thiosulfate/3-mercaptopyruvate sulfurtransferase
MHTSLISASDLHSRLTTPSPLFLFDCSNDLGDAELGPRQYREGHIPGAVHVHLDTVLSDHEHGINGGRHPLPSRERIAQTLERLGFSSGMQAVAYDRQGGIYAGRWWWMLKWCGHDAVAVLDGGWAAWQAMGGAIEIAPPVPHLNSEGFVLKPPLVQMLSQTEVQAQLDSPGMTLIDARGAPRFRGEVEPLDPVAGHIPGAFNRPFTDNVGPDGRFKPADQLRQEFLALLGDRSPESVVHHCGSGVSALPNLLAMEIAGLGRTRLYPGSWSEWCTTEGTPRTTGA